MASETRQTIRADRARLILPVLCVLAMSCRAPRTETYTDGPASTPRRIVSLIPAATEILFALGAGDRLVGRTRWGVHPPEAAAVPDVGDGVRPSLEVVIARDPELVILFEGQDTEGIAGRLGDMGIPILSLRHNSLADLHRNVALLGEAVGCSGAAQALSRRIEEDLRDVSQAVAGLERRRVYYDVWTDPPMTIGRGSYLDSLVTIAGGRNVFGDLEAPSPEVGLEAIVHRDPEIIVHPVSRAPDAFDDPPEKRAAWQAVGAVSAGRVAVVDADLLGRLGPRVGAATRELALALHPTARIDPLPAVGNDRCSP
ncbi:MAG: helical backbone metal receptor [Gemmatimonadota bacterium]|nr:helical backbone metal receptor [Gemmatimonadota bacterium]